VYETPPETVAAAGFDAVGGIQVHAGRLTSALDQRGIEQIVITAYRPAAPRVERVAPGPGSSGWVYRSGGCGRPTAWRRSARWRGAADVDLVHLHLGETWRSR
jgi:hypothetical protein